MLAVSARHRQSEWERSLTVTQSRGFNPVRYNVQWQSLQRLSVQSERTVCACQYIKN